MFGVFIVGLMIALTAYFVAAEFAVVKVNKTKIKKLASEGNKKAQNALRVVSNMDTYLSSCQLGITIASLLLGWVGEPAVEHVLEPIFHSFHLSEGTTHIVSLIIAFSLVTFIHVIIGELVPKTMAIRYAEKIAMELSSSLIIFYKVMKPIIWSMNAIANFICSLFGVKASGGHDETYSEEELILLMNESLVQGEINSTEYKYVNNIFDFDEIQAREIMVPRKDMVTIDLHDQNDEIFNTLSNEPFTRFPVIDSDKDNIVGFIHSKEFFIHYIKNKEFKLEDITRSVIYASEAKPIKEVLKQMQDEQIHFVVLADEYGGTEGIITLEDILEEIVGEIRDEFDYDEKPEIQKVKEGEVIVDGKVSIYEINDLFESNIDEHNLDTIGGWLFMQNPNLKAKETFRKDHLEFELLERSNTRFKRIKIIKTA